MARRWRNETKKDISQKTHNLILISPARIDDLPLHINIKEAFLLVLWTNDLCIVRLNQDKLFPPTDNTVKVLIGVCVKDRLGPSTAQPKVDKHQMISETTTKEKLWQLPLSEHQRRNSTHHVDVGSVVFLGGGGWRERCVYLRYKLTKPYI